MRRRAAAAALAWVALLVSSAALAKPLRLWHAYRSAEEQALLAILAQFPGEPIETLSVPYDAYGSKLAAAIPIGDGPDVFIDSHERLGDYRARKIVAPVGDALEDGVYALPALAAVRDDAGVAWAVPLSQKCLALYVNTDLVRDVPAELEDIVAMKGRLPHGVFPLAYAPQSAYMLAPVLAAFGGRILAGDDAFAFQDASGVKTLDFARALVASGAVPEDADGALVTDLFRSGRAAFAISGPWFAAELGDKVKYRVASLPRLHATGLALRPLLTVESAMLSPDGAKRPEARALVRFLASASAASIRAHFGPTPTARSDVELPAGNDLARAFALQATVAVPMRSSQAMRAAWDPADRAIRKVLRGDAEPQAALDEAKRRFDDVESPLPPRASPAPALFVVGVVALLAALNAVKRAREEWWGKELVTSLPAYAYVAHAVVALGLLVMTPLVIGALTSLTAGNDDTRRYVGLANFVSILVARGGPLLASGSFYLVLAVNVLWTVVNVFFHVTLGVALAVVLSRPGLRLRGLYRVLLIVPWAVPSYVTALVWKGMFHRQFGAVTALLLSANHIFGTHIEPISWFAKFSTAFSANAVTNIWLGFPFMMVVTLGALTGVPEDVLEAAKVDGATRWQRFRLVTLPIIRPTLMPAVLLGAIWTFNMFNVVFLVSGGDPDGTTDILASEAYRWAFTRQNQYGYAAAYSVLIFFLLYGTTRLFGRKRAQSTEAA